MEDANFTDDVIISEILAGNTNRYALLMQKYNQRLYRICKGYIRDEAEIEDLMQETYVKAFVHLRTFKGSSAFSSWLTRILINEALQRLRTIKREATTIEPAPETLTKNSSDKINPETTSMNKELREIIEKNIEALPEKYRVVFLMREVERMNVSETAETLQISETNVKVRLNRAKEMLRASLMESYQMEELYGFNLVRCTRIANNVLTRLSGWTTLRSTIPN